MRSASLVALLAASACEIRQPPFEFPRSAEDARARLLQAIPEGRDMPRARAWMAEHGFRCGAPTPPDAEVRTSSCEPARPDVPRWTITLTESHGRLKDALAAAKR